MHGRALTKFPDRAGHPVPPRAHGRTTLMDHVDRTMTTLMSTAWKERLARPGVARVVRAIMNRLHVPVGASHQPDELARWVSGFLFDGEEGRLAARRVDKTIAELPGFADLTLLGDWLARKVYN